MFFNKGVVLLLLSQSVESFTVSNSVAFAPRLLSSSPACLNTALFSEPEASSVEEPAAVEEPIADIPVATEDAVAAVVDEPVAAVEEAAVAEAEADSGFNVYISNMTFDHGKDKVNELFAPFGEIKAVSVPLNKMTMQPRGFAFVTMANQAAGEAAIAALNGNDCDGRTLNVVKQLPKEEMDQIKKERPPRRRAGLKIYVGNLPFDTTKEELSNMFGKYGAVSDVFIPEDRATQRPRGFAFVTMPDEEAKAAMEDLNGTEFGGRELRVNESKPRGEGGNTGPREPRPDVFKLYVGNISFATEEQELRDVFAEYGEITDLYAPLDQETGRPRGFAFVTMAQESAEQAMNEVDGMELDGRILKVNQAQAKGAPRARDNYNDDSAFTTYEPGYSNEGGFSESNEGDANADSNWGSY